MQLIELMHNLYKNDKLTSDVAAAIDGSLDRVREGIEDTKRQNILDTATWFLSQKEKELGVDNDTDDVRLRRARILARNIMSSKCSLETLQGIFNGFGLTAGITVKDMVLTLELTGCEDSPFVEQAKVEIDKAAPAHLGLEWHQVAKPLQTIFCGTTIVSGKYEIINPQYEDINTGILSAVAMGTYLSGIRREVMDCEVITPVSAGGDIVGSILVYGITDNGIAGYIKPEIQETYVTICRGGSQRFTVQEVISDSVIWSVAGNTDSATAIDENGFLNVGENEESTSLTVTATTVDGVASCSVSAAVDLSVTVLRLFDSGELDICPMSGMVITQKQSNGTDYEITDRIYRIRTAVTNASTDIKVPFTRNLTGYSKLCFNGGFLTAYGSQYDILSVGLYDSSDSATTLTIHSGYGSFELEIDQTKEYSALMIGSCYGEIEITKIWLEP